MSAYAEAELHTSVGKFAVVDYGGLGPDCVLIHGTGQNAFAWRDFAAALVHRYHLVAFDLRGHGQTQENSTTSDQYWRDIGPIIKSLDMDQPILMGHSSGAYAAMAHVASGGAARAIVCVDGFTLDARDDVLKVPDWAITRSRLFDMFRYGWKTTPHERDAYIEQVVAGTEADPFNVGIEASLLRSMLRRCFAEKHGVSFRRPSMTEIEIVGAPVANAAIGPYRDIYEQIDVPLLLVWAEQGLSARRFEEIVSLVHGDPRRGLITVDASHNVPMQRPVDLARVVCNGLERLFQPR